MAVVNSGMIDYTLNWIESLRLTEQEDRFLVFVINQGVADELTSKGCGRHVTLIPNAWLHVPLASDMALWKSNKHRPITHAKSLVVERLLYLGITVWFTDVDIVLLSPFIRQTLLTQMAQRPNTHLIFSQEVDQCSNNSGFCMMKPSKITILSGLLFKDIIIISIDTVVVTSNTIALGTVTTTICSTSFIVVVTIIQIRLVIYTIIP